MRLKTSNLDQNLRYLEFDLSDFETTCVHLEQNLTLDRGTDKAVFDDNFGIIFYNSRVKPMLLVLVRIASPRRF